MMFSDDAYLKEEFYYLFASLFRHPDIYIRIIETLAKKQYELHFRERVFALIDKMDAITLGKYIKELVFDNMKVGIEILKQQSEKEEG